MKRRECGGLRESAEPESPAGTVENARCGKHESEDRANASREIERRRNVLNYDQTDP